MVGCNWQCSDERDLSGESWLFHFATGKIPTVSTHWLAGHGAKRRCVVIRVCYCNMTITKTCHHNSQRIVRKIDCHISLWAFVMFFALDLDRSNLSSANSDNFLDDLNMNTDAFQAYPIPYHLLSPTRGYTPSHTGHFPPHWNHRLGRPCEPSLRPIYPSNSRSGGPCFQVQYALSPLRYSAMHSHAFSPAWRETWMVESFKQRTVYFLQCWIDVVVLLMSSFFYIFHLLQELHKSFLHNCHLLCKML